MAKKRVHELAKQYDMPSAEVMKRLNDYGLKVKASASAVDEEEAERALTGKAPRQESNGKPDAPRAPQQTGMGFDRPATESARQRLAERQQRQQEAAKKKQPPKKPAKPAGKDDGAAPQAGDGQGGGERRQRPTRSSLQGERTPGAAGGVRRVVIDSQASRRGPGGPGQGGPGGGPPGMGPRRPPRRGGRRRRGTYVEPAAQDVASLKADVIRVNSGSTVKDVGEYLGVPVPEIIKKLMSLGEMAMVTQTLSDDTIQILAEEFEKEIEIVHAADEADAEVEFEDTDEELEPRAPVVTIMGHVDHGKTSLLDAIRETEVAAGEAGGITQHIGAYQVHHGDDKIITFLDTPGHEAFTAMRARGAQSTDIAVIVVAADDGVKPQTREAVDHAKAAEVPILVAVNKIDKEGAQPERVRQEMTQLGLQPEEWGGETMFVDVSAKTKQNLEDLLESILLLAEVEELKANPDAEASGVVIESRLDPGRGAVVTVLVQRGTMKVGDALVAGAHWGRVRAMHDYMGNRVKEAGPSEPVEVLGFDSVPEAGEFVRVVENDRRARSLAGERATRLKLEQQARRGGRKKSLETIFDEQRAGEVMELNLVLKADVSGSLEAFEDEIAKLPQADVEVNIVRAGVGGITESDVNLAAASDAIIIGFNVRPVGEAAAVADREGVEIRTYSVIYRAFEDLRDAMQGMLAPEEVEETVGEVEIRAIFKASRVGTIAGSYVTEGKVTRGAKVRLVRDGAVIYDGQIASLRRVQEDVREVAAGFECGIVLQNYADIKEGDQLEVYETRQVERTLS
jgi:translation initiation factor IF-2